MPAGQGGVISLSYSPAALYHAGLVASALALVVLAAIAIGCGRRRSGWRPGRRLGQWFGRWRPRADRPRARTAALMVRLAPVVPLAVVIWLAGGPMVLAVPLLAGLGWRRPRWLPPVAFGSMLLAGVVAASAGSFTAMGSGAFGGSGPGVRAGGAHGRADAGDRPPGHRDHQAVGRSRGGRAVNGRASGESDGGEVPRSPFDLIDELSCYYDTPAEPNNVLSEVLVPGAIDYPTLRRAVAGALAAEPQGPRADGGGRCVPPPLHLGVPARSRHRPAVAYHLVGRAGAAGGARPLHGDLAVAARPRRRSGCCWHRGRTRAA